MVPDPQPYLIAGIILIAAIVAALMVVDHIDRR